MVTELCLETVHHLSSPLGIPQQFWPLESVERSWSSIFRTDCYLWPVSFPSCFFFGSKRHKGRSRGTPLAAHFSILSISEQSALPETSKYNPALNGDTGAQGKACELTMVIMVNAQCWQCLAERQTSSQILIASFMLDCETLTCGTSYYSHNTCDKTMLQRLPRDWSDP